MKKYVVLGSSSFSGSSFIKFLVNAKNEENQVLGISRTSLKGKPFDACPEDGQTFRNLILDLDSNIDQILKEIESFKADYIVNFAAMSMVGESWGKPHVWYNTNLVSFSKLIDGLVQMGGFKRFIQFTTPEVYGSTRGLLKESWEFSPSTPYAISRAASDWHLKAFCEMRSFPVIFTRAANVYGEHQRLYRLIPKAVFSAITEKKFPLHGGGSSLRSFIHIDDVSRALSLIAEGGKIGDCYHISTNEFIQINEVVSSICEVLNADFSKLVEVTGDRLGKDQAYTLDSSKLRSELNWQDKISLKEGIMKTFYWVNRNLESFTENDLNYQIGGKS